MFKWVGKSARWGVREVATLVSYRRIKDNADEIREHAETVLNPLKQREGREETFQNAYRRLDLDEETLQRVYFTHRLRFYIGLVFMMGALGLMVVALLSPHWWVGLPALAAAAVCLSQMFSSSLRAYQINHRELVGVDVWWNASKEWWPGPFVTLEEFQKQIERAERRAARRAARKSSKRDLTVVDRDPR